MQKANAVKYGTRVQQQQNGNTAFANRNASNFFV